MLTTALYRANKSWVFKITTKGKGISGSQSGGGPPSKGHEVVTGGRRNANDFHNESFCTDGVQRRLTQKY